MFKLAKNLELPTDAVTQAFALLARRGAGKTHTASVMAEEMLAGGFPIVVLDPIGVWWGLRSAFPIVILGGEHGDVPLEPTSGKVVAEFVVAQRMPVILDLMKFGENEMRRFVADFAQRLYEKNREPLHLFVDEADEFAPQNAAGGPLAASLGAMQNVVRRGRARGIGVTLITQRSAVLNKSVLTQTECLIAMQTTSPHDLRAVREWITYHADKAECDQIMQTLPKLQQGEAWVYSPGWLKLLERVKFRPRTSFDSSRTPKPGEARKNPKTLADVDLGALTKSMQETIERAKADDPKLLRKRIADLEKQLAAKSAEPVVDRKAIDVAAAAAAGECDTAWRKQFVAAIQAIREAIAKEEKATEKFLTSVRPFAKQAASPPATVRQSTARPAAAEATSGDTPELAKAERAILTAFYWLKDEDATPAKVAFYADYSAKSSSFANAIGKLRSLGMVNGWKITLEGFARIADVCESKPTGRELREWLRAKLGKAENALLDALMEAHPRRLEKLELSEASGYSMSSSSFANSLGRLRSLEAVKGGERDGGVKAADVFFEG